MVHINQLHRDNTLIICTHGLGSSFCLTLFNVTLQFAPHLAKKYYNIVSILYVREPVEDSYKINA